MKCAFLALILIGCSSVATGQSPPSSDDAAALPTGDDGQGEAVVSLAPDVSDSGPACLSLPAVNGPPSDDCFPFGSCASCGVLAGGVLFWCMGDAGVHPPVPGCEQDNAAQAGWVGSCCPSSSTSCTRLSSQDAFCKAQNLSGSPPPNMAYACPATGQVVPQATGCQPPTQNSDAGPGGGNFPAQRAALYCCSS
jgi:hypothetical protein